MLRWYGTMLFCYDLLKIIGTMYKVIATSEKLLLHPSCVVSLVHVKEVTDGRVVRAGVSVTRNVGAYCNDLEVMSLRCVVLLCKSYFNTKKKTHIPSRSCFLPFQNQAKPTGAEIQGWQVVVCDRDSNSLVLYTTVTDKIIVSVGT